MRVNVNLSEELVKKLDERAEALNISRSAYISLACSEKMKTEDALEMMPKLMAQLEAMKKSEASDKQ